MVAASTAPVIRASAGSADAVAGDAVVEGEGTAGVTAVAVAVALYLLAMALSCERNEDDRQRR